MPCMRTKMVTLSIFFLRNLLQICDSSGNYIIRHGAKRGPKRGCGGDEASAYYDDSDDVNIIDNSVKFIEPKITSHFVFFRSKPFGAQYSA